MGPDDLERLAERFEVEIGGVYGYVAGALRQEAHDRRRAEADTASGSR